MANTYTGAKGRYGDNARRDYKYAHANTKDDDSPKDNRVRLQIDGCFVKSVLPKNFQVGRYLVSDLARTAAGNMKGQYLGMKLKLFITYPSITGAELKVITDILYGPDAAYNATTGERTDKQDPFKRRQDWGLMFHRVRWTEDCNGEPFYRTAKMYAGDCTKTLMRTGRVASDKGEAHDGLDSMWIWQDVTFDLIEA